MRLTGELVVYFLLGCILVNIVLHAQGFVAASDATFGYTNRMFSSLTSKKG